MWLVAGLTVAIAGRAGAGGIEPLPPPPDAIGGPVLQSPAPVPSGPVFGEFGHFGHGPTSPYPPMAPPVYPQRAVPPPVTSFGDCPELDGPCEDLPWVWQLLPEGLVYRSYLAGVKEPRLGLVITSQSGFGPIWDAVLGARVALLRYGTPTAYRPEGWEVQLEGAAMPRLQPVEESTPLVSTDYRIGVPVAYANGPWQFKTGYYHVSAHLGDEFMILNPGVTRINYVRDAIMLGVGYYYTEDLRLFAEFDYAPSPSGGAEPCEFQFGVDYSPAVRGGAPFAAFYGNLRQELDYGGFFVVQAGWQWRGGAALHTMRLGVEYLNGQSPQYEFFNTFEHHVGFGIWYDF
jgi:hypothetical protein